MSFFWNIFAIMSILDNWQYYSTTKKTLIIASPFIIIGLFYFITSMIGGKKEKFTMDLEPLKVGSDFIYDGLDHKYGANKKHRHHSF